CFFFQAEDGIRDRNVTGVQTCALPISRERINYLLDKDSFVELNTFIEHRSTDFGMDNSIGKGEGVVTGYGKINGRQVFLFAQDFTVYGGALGEMHGKKIANVMDLAAKNGVPFIGLND